MGPALNIEVLPDDMREVFSEGRVVRSVDNSVSLQIALKVISLATESH